jgi:hypothetical protein
LDLDRGSIAPQVAPDQSSPAVVEGSDVYFTISKLFLEVAADHQKGAVCEELKSGKSY